MTDETRVLNLAWYAFTVKTGKERPVSRLLSQKGYDAPLPEVEYTTRATWRSKRKAETRRFPALRSYMLVGFDPEEPEPAILDVEGTLWIHRVHRNAEGIPMRIPGKEMLNFLLSDKFTFRELMRRAKPDFALNDTVVFTEGAFSNRRGKVVGMCAEARRAKVEAELLGSVREIDVEFCELKKVDAEAA